MCLTVKFNQKVPKEGHSSLSFHYLSHHTACSKVKHFILAALELQLSRDTELSLVMLFKFNACYEHYATL